jgi:hypothetical protein
MLICMNSVDVAYAKLLEDINNGTTNICTNKLEDIRKCICATHENTEKIWGYFKAILIIYLVFFIILFLSFICLLVLAVVPNSCMNQIVKNIFTLMSKLAQQNPELKLRGNFDKDWRFECVCVI